MLLDQGHQLIPERDPGMVLGLRPDIPADLQHPRLADRNRKVSSLPFEPSLDLPVVVDPAGRIRLQDTDRRGDRKVRPELREQMHVVRHAADLDQDAALAAQDTAQVLVDRLPEVLGDQRDAALRGEDDVVKEIGEAGRHGLLSPFQGFRGWWGDRVPGAHAPGSMLPPLRGWVGSVEEGNT
jgi:hypothetical protein